jgi:mRNA deadenylase 3'-5' endonuclease subunit Ccr4
MVNKIIFDIIYFNRKGTLDYIFFDPLKKEEKDSLILKSIVEIPSEEIVSKQKGLPSDEFGSDHVSIMAVFELL